MLKYLDMWERQIHQRVMLPHRVTSKDWKNWLTEAHVQQREAQSLEARGEQHQEPAMHPHSKKRLAVSWILVCRLREVIFLFYSTRVWFWAFWYEKVWTYWSESNEDSHTWSADWSFFLHGKLWELGLFRLEKRRHILAERAKDLNGRNERDIF